MKLLLKVIAAFLITLIIAAACFWVWCRLVNGRSFMAGFTDLFLTIQHRSDKFTYPEAADAYIESMRETNSLPVEISRAKFGVSLREIREDGFQAFVFNGQEHPAQTVFYFHGGAFVNQPNAQQRAMAARTARETGCEVVLMVYPKIPVSDCEESCRKCIDFYKRYADGKDCGKTVFMGDSAGGGLALVIAMKLRDEGLDVSDDMILISPWVDLSMSNPDLREYTENDPMLGIDGLRRMGEVWAGDLPLNDPAVSPIYGDLSSLGRVLLTTGTWEVLYPDTLLLSEKLREAGTDVQLITGERMIHCYPIIPVPEAKDAQALIWEAVTR